MSRPKPVAGGGLLHPLPILAVLVLVLNDHWWKHAYSSWFTGKLSDVAGLAFFPLLLQALWEYAAALLRRPRRPSRRVLMTSAAATGTFFALSNVWSPAAEAYRHGLWSLQWPLRALLAVIRDQPLPETFGRVVLTADPTDLLALPALGLALWAGWRRCSAGADTGSGSGMTP